MAETKRKKTGGRQKGTPNKATAFSRAVVNEVLSDYVTTNKLKDDLAGLTKKDRLDVMIKLAAFVIPKPQSIDMNLNVNDEKRTIEKTLIEESQINEDA
jgi:hypothetical protein